VLSLLILVLTGSTFRKQSRRDIPIFHYLGLQVASSSAFKDMAGMTAQADQAATWVGPSYDSFWGGRVVK
jgi:hypothetical protein